MRPLFALFILFLKNGMISSFTIQRHQIHTTALSMSRPHESRRRDFLSVATGILLVSPRQGRAEGLPYYKKDAEYAVGPSYQKDRATRVRRLSKRAFLASAKMVPMFETTLDEFKNTTFPSVQGAIRIRKALRDYPFSLLRQDGKEILTLMTLEDEAFPPAAGTRGWGDQVSTGLAASLAALDELDYACLRVEQRLDTQDTGLIDKSIVALKGPLTELGTCANTFADSVLGTIPLEGTSLGNAAPKNEQVFSTSGETSSGWSEALKMRENKPL